MTPAWDVWSRLEDTLLGAVSALEDACTPVDTWTVEAGEPSWDYCCGQGHAYVRVVQAGPTDQFPTLVVDPRHCGYETAAYVEVGVLRCAPTLDSRGNPPDPAEVTAAARSTYEDMQTLHAYLTSISEEWDPYGVALDTWEPLDLEGGCQGGAWRLWMWVRPCAPTCENGST